MTDKIFKFQNIQLHPSNTCATHQNTVFQPGGTAEEQFAQIQASSRQSALNDIWAHEQATASEQIQDVSSSSVEEQAPPTQLHTTVTTSTSSFEVVHQDDNTQTVSHVPRIPDQHLQAPIDPQNIQDIWSDDDEENITAINKGTSTRNVKAIIHTNVATKVKSSIKVDSTDTEDADDEADDDDIEYFRQLTKRCTALELKIATDGFHIHCDKLHDLIPELYANKFDISDFPHLSSYYSQAIGLLPNQEFVHNVLYLVFQKFPHLQTIQEYLYSVIKCFLVGLKHPDWMQFHFIDDNVSDPTLTEDHIQESYNEHLAEDQDNSHDKTQDFDCTYVTTDSIFLEQRLLQKQAVYRTVLCPDLKKLYDTPHRELKQIPQMIYHQNLKPQ